jgi:endonuclease YncB( thermonuclease family)
MKTRCILPLLLLLSAPLSILAQDSTETPQPTHTIAAASSIQRDTAVVRKVASLTSFTTASGEKITVLGIALPKSKAIDAEDAKLYLAGLIEGKTVVLVRDTALGPDTKGSKLRYVYLDGRLVNREMIDDGFAAANGRHSMSREFASAEKDARKYQKAAWDTERLYAIQCQGITQKGSQCSRTTRSLSGKCWQHE